MARRVRNDTGMSIAAARAYLTDQGVDIRYGSGTLRVERAALEEARRVVARIPAETRPMVMEMVDASLREILPRAVQNRAPRREMDEFYRNMLLWAALREVAS
jgi:hypothetical protein